jgi:hypothetical protein
MKPIKKKEKAKINAKAQAGYKHGAKESGESCKYKMKKGKM